MSGDEPGRETQLLQRHEYSPQKYLWTSKRDHPKRKDILLCPVPLEREVRNLFGQAGLCCPSRCGSVCHLHACACVYARTWLFLLAKLRLETCNLEGLTVSRGRDAAPPQTIIITCWTKHGSRVTEEHRCLHDQGPADTKGCIRADPTDTPLLSRLKHPCVGIGGSGSKLFTTLCRP